MEPPREMIRQRPPGAATVVRDAAPGLPFAGGAFDAAMALLAVRHWPDRWRAWPTCGG